MSVRRCIRTLPYLLALFQFQLWIVTTDFVAFQRLGALDGHACPAEYTDTKINVVNRTKCLLHCARNASCRGVFFEPQTLMCIQCAAQFFHLNNTISTWSMFYKLKDKVFAYKLVEEKMPWNEAKQNCISLGGQLSTVKSPEEQTFLANILSITLPHGVWIGGNGTAGDENSFEWFDGTRVSNGYVNWENFSNESGLNCMKMGKRIDYKWINKNCTDTVSSVCKIE